MSEEEFEDIELSYKEQDSLNRLNKKEMDIFNQSIERFINDPTDSKNIWYVVDNLIEFEDSIIHIKKNYYEGFDKLILKSKKLLDDACNIPNIDLTIKGLMIETVQKIKQFLAILTDKGYFIKDNKDFSTEILHPTDEKAKFPFHEYKKTVPLDKSPSAEIGKRFAEHLMKKSKDPHYEGNETQEELNSMINEISLVHEGEIPFPKEELYDPKITEYLIGGIQKLRERAEDYQNKKKELTELSNAKAELKNEGNSLEEFKKKLLDRCIDNMIAQGK
jgi:hypothetical protein